MTPASPKRVLVSNVSHFVYAAVALYERRLIDRYFSISVFDSLPSWASLPLGRAVGRQISEARLFPFMSGLPVTRLVVPEIISRLGSVFGKGQLGTQRAARYFGLRVAHSLGSHVESFHFVSGLGVESLRRMTWDESLVICDRRATHHSFEARLVGEYVGRRGLPYVHPEASLLSRFEEEYRRANVIIVPSMLAKQSFEEAGVRNVEVVEYGVNVDLFSYSPMPSMGRCLRCLYVGRPTASKGLFTLIEALGRCRTPIELMIVGARSPEFEEALRGLDARVRFLGILHGEALREAYAEAHVLLVPSIVDAAPLVVLEAMACGRPVILTDGCGNSDLVESGQEGVVVKAADPLGLAAAIDEVASDGEWRREASVRARRSAEMHSWKEYGNQLTEIYRRYA